jgi:hypothetical protein
MPNPIVNKTITKVVTPQQELGLDKISKPDKTGDSKFDKIKAQKLQEQSTSAVNLPPEVTQVTAIEKKKIEGDLRKRMAANRTGGPQDLFRVDFSNTRASLDNLRARVSQLPKTQGMEPVRSRLASIESQFEASGKLLNSGNMSTDPRDMLKVQVQMYQMSQNIELVTKVVDQVNSGVKSILQTQV